MHPSALRASSVRDSRRVRESRAAVLKPAAAPCAPGATFHALRPGMRRRSWWLASASSGAKVTTVTRSDERTDRPSPACPGDSVDRDPIAFLLPFRRRSRLLPVARPGRACDPNTGGGRLQADSKRAPSRRHRSSCRTRSWFQRELGTGGLRRGRRSTPCVARASASGRLDRGRGVSVRRPPEHSGFSGVAVTITMRSNWTLLIRPTSLGMATPLFLDASHGIDDGSLLE